MTQLNRREAAKTVAVIAASGMALTPSGVFGKDEVQKSLDSAATGKAEEAFVNYSPLTSMLLDAGTIDFDGDGRSRDLIINDVLDERGLPLDVHVPSHAMRVFRVRSTTGDAAENATLNWTFRNDEGQNGTVELAVPGQMVMVMRDGSNVARLFVLQPDFRC